MANQSKTKEGFTIKRVASTATSPFYVPPNSCIPGRELEYCQYRGINPYHALKGRHR